MKDIQQPEKHTPTPLEISQEKLRAIVDSVVDGIITIDRFGVIQAANPAAERMFGYKAGELLGQNVSRLMPEPHAQSHDQYLRNYLDTHEARIIGIGRELEAKRKDGSFFPIELAVSEVDHLSIFTGVIRDITERKKQQQQLLESERLAGLGQATAGLVHESRNSLARIQANLRMMRRRIPEEPELLQLMGNAINASENLSQQFEEVREYSASLKPKYALKDLRNLINEAWGQLNIEENSPNAELIVSSGPENTCVEVDPFLVTNAFRNIFQNSLDAMNAQGHIKVTFQEEMTAKAPRLRVIFEDDGAGISKEEASRAFDAFYSTKTRGTGLGLAIVKRYIEAHGGTVGIEPHSLGTRVTLTFPISTS